MNAREVILTAVRRNLPQPPVSLPEIPNFGHTADARGSILIEFDRQLRAIGGRSIEVASAVTAQAKVNELFPDAKVICSAVPELPGTRSITDVHDPHELDDVDVGILRSPLGVAEAGAIWVTQTELVINALGVLS